VGANSDDNDSGVERRWWQRRWFPVKGAKDVVTDWLYGGENEVVEPREGGRRLRR